MTIPATNFPANRQRYLDNERMLTDLERHKLAKGKSVVLQLVDGIIIFGSDGDLGNGVRMPMVDWRLAWFHRGGKADWARRVG